MAMKSLSVGTGILLVDKIDLKNKNISNGIASASLAIQDDNEYISTPIDEFKKIFLH